MGTFIPIPEIYFGRSKLGLKERVEQEATLGAALVRFLSL